jgi:hypothetical protein
MKEGKPIWVESLLTPQEWKYYKNKYSTYSSDKPPELFEGDFYWRRGMGEGFTTEEIRITNARIDAVLEKFRLKKSQNN